MHSGQGSRSLCSPYLGEGNQKEAEEEVKEEENGKSESEGGNGIK